MEEREQEISFQDAPRMMVSERVLALIKERGISQKEFSRRTGIAESTISDWKNKKTNPNVDRLPSISRALDVSLEVLLSGVKGCDEGQTVSSPMRGVTSIAFSAGLGG